MTMNDGKPNPRNPDAVDRGDIKGVLMYAHDPVSAQLLPLPFSAFAPGELGPNTARLIGKPALSLAGLAIPGYDNFHDIKAARPAGCVAALITVELISGSVRVNVTGQDPRGGNGHVIAPGSRITLDHPDEVDKFRVALESGTSATLIVTYF